MKIHNILPNSISLIDGVHVANAIVHAAHRHHADYEGGKMFEFNGNVTRV